MHSLAGSPLYGVLCHDWIKRAGITESVFSFLLLEQGEERHGLLPKHYNKMISVRI